MRYGFGLSDCSEIWQVHWQHCCQCTCQVSEWLDHVDTQSCGFEVSWDLAMRHLTLSKQKLWIVSVLGITSIDCPVWSCVWNSTWSEPRTYLSCHYLCYFKSRIHWAEVVSRRENKHWISRWPIYFFQGDNKHWKLTQLIWLGLNAGGLRVTLKE